MFASVELKDAYLILMVGFRSDRETMQR